MLKDTKSSALFRQVLHLQLESPHRFFSSNLREILLNAGLLVKPVRVDEVSNSAESHDFLSYPLKNRTNVVMSECFGDLKNHQQRHQQKQV